MKSRRLSDMLRALMGWTVLLAVAIGPAIADTIQMQNGVSFDGVVQKENPDGTVNIKVGDRDFVYRKEEISQIEKNERTGRFNKEEAIARWKQADAELTNETGLNAEQRAQVNAIFLKMLNTEEGERLAARDQLVALQKEMDVFRYLAHELPSMAYTSAPLVLEVLVLIDPARATPCVRDSVLNQAPGTRAKAIELLGKLRDLESIPLISRGLVDPVENVRIMAAYSVANLDALNATPVLLENLKHPDMRVTNASREALQALWKNALGEQKLQTVEEWTAFWQAQASKVPSPIDITSLQPLVDPDFQFVAG